MNWSVEICETQNKWGRTWTAWEVLCWAWYILWSTQIGLMHAHCDQGTLFAGDRGRNWRWCEYHLCQWVAWQGEQLQSGALGSQKYISLQNCMLKDLWREFALAQLMDCMMDCRCMKQWSRRFEVVKTFSSAGCQAYCESCNPYLQEHMNGLPMGFHGNSRSIGH
jgi:hypothetical protein